MGFFSLISTKDISSAESITNRQGAYCDVMSSVPNSCRSWFVIPLQPAQIGGDLDSLIEQINGRLHFSIDTGFPFGVNQAPLIRSSPSSFLICKWSFILCKIIKKWLVTRFFIYTRNDTFKIQQVKLSVK